MVHSNPAKSQKTGINSQTSGKQRINSKTYGVSSKITMTQPKDQLDIAGFCCPWSLIVFTQLVQCVNKSLNCCDVPRNYKNHLNQSYRLAASERKKPTIHRKLRNKRSSKGFERYKDAK
jgi:hypothetical protein